MFERSVSALLSTFERVTFGFTCCAGAADPSLRRSAEAHWQSLCDAVGRAAETTSIHAKKAAFTDRVSEAVNELEALKILGERLAALRPVTVEVSDRAAQRLAADWTAVSDADGWELLESQVKSSFEKLLASLPGVERRWLPDGSAGAADDPFGWLLASLGIPADLALNDVLASSAVKSKGDQNRWTDWTSGDDPRWSGDVRFDCRWNLGAETIPSEWINGAGPQTVSGILREKIPTDQAGKSIADLLARCLQDGDSEAVGSLVRALTHAHPSRGLFPEQSLRAGDPDAYAYTAVHSAAAKFERLASVARCQQLVANGLVAGARLSWPSIDAQQSPDANPRSAPLPLGKLAATMWRAYVFRLYQSAKGRPLKPDDLSLRPSDPLSMDPWRRLVRAIRSGRLLSRKAATAWMENPSDSERTALESLVEVGAALAHTADERLQGFLHARLSYARASEWFPQKQTHIQALLGRLEDRKTDANEAWNVYRGDPNRAGRLGGANTESYRLLFSKD
jgi:hypothetical protein